MSRKPLDLQLLNQAFEEQQDPTWDRATKRAMQIANSAVGDIEQFQVIEIDNDEILLTATASNLPSDEEIIQMKRELAERDKIEAEQQASSINRFPWWRRLLKMMRLSN